MQIGFRVFEWFCEKYEIFNETTCTCQEKVNETIETPPPEEGRLPWIHQVLADWCGDNRTMCATLID